MYVLQPDVRIFSLLGEDDAWIEWMVSMFVYVNVHVELRSILSVVVNGYLGNKIPCWYVHMEY